jgi:hypothetical protein
LAQTPWLARGAKKMTFLYVAAAYPPPTPKGRGSGPQQQGDRVSAVAAARPTNRGLAESMEGPFE